MSKAAGVNGKRARRGDTRRRAALQQRYEWAQIVNDLLLGTWFLTGSILFFYDHLQRTGRWFFLLGTGQMLLRPAIRIAHKLHVDGSHGGSKPSSEYLPLLER